MVEVIKFLNLGEWTVVVLSVIVIWRWVLKDLAEKWFQNKLDLQTQEVGSALQIQNNIAVSKAEFEKVKLERVLPLLEKINSLISEHKMMYNSYILSIGHKGGIPDDFERKRVDLDKKIVKSISSTEIYLPKVFRAVILQIRKIISCSWKNPLEVYYLLLEEGSVNCVFDVCSGANDLYGDLLNCFYDMCNKYLGLSENSENYYDILKHHNFSEKIQPINPNPAQKFLWRYLLVHEYFSSGEQSEVISDIKSAYKLSEK